MTKSSIMSDLMSVIVDRKRDPQAEKSYVASLMKAASTGFARRSSRKPPRSWRLATNPATLDASTSSRK